MPQAQVGPHCDLYCDGHLRLAVFQLQESKGTIATLREEMGICIQAIQDLRKRVHALEKEKERLDKEVKGAKKVADAAKRQLSQL